MVRLILLTVFILQFFMFSQQIEERAGKVTYLSSQNVYVEYFNTKGINTGDTLFFRDLNNTLIPAAVANYISGRSVAATPTGALSIEKEMILFVFVSVQEEKSDPKIEVKEVEQPVKKEVETESKITVKNKGRKSVYGRFSAQSVSDFGNTPVYGYNQRFRYSLSFTANEINELPLSFNFYSILAYRVSDLSKSEHNLGKMLKIYSLNLEYNLDSLTELKAGRFIESNLSSIGTVDGISFIRKFDNFDAGLILGSRPNFSDNGLNFNLFQFGGFISNFYESGSTSTRNSLGIVNQTESFNTDRRFIYFQNSTYFSSLLSFFGSAEADIFKNENGEAKTTFSLTNYYLTIRYKPVNEINLSLSFDGRKNIIYYETFKSFLDSVLENEMLNGFRISALIKPVKNLFFSLRYGYRSTSSDARASTHYGFSINYLNPLLFDTMTELFFNSNTGAYLTGKNFGFSLSRDLTDEISLRGGFRYNSYIFEKSNIDFVQRILDFEIYWQILRNLYASISFEGQYETLETFNRIYFSVSTKF
ncbi:MAG: hypothetical protein IAE91_08415 [Ignavibacteriaceae bacterium]|nr:hypothetical protein [Ignavibacteriaceae bacterium]